jgi:hypothetical protein
MKKFLLALVIFFSMGMVLHTDLNSSTILLKITNPYGVTIRIKTTCGDLAPKFAVLKKKTTTVIRLPKHSDECHITVYDYSLF